MAVRVLVTDGSSAIRDTIRRHLECIGCEIVAEAQTAEQALPLFRTVRPEIVIMSADLGYADQANPIDLVRLIKREVPESSVLMITGDAADPNAQDFRLAGALGCFAPPFDFASLWRTLSIAHPDLMAGTFATMISTTAALKTSRISR